MPTPTPAPFSTAIMAGLAGALALTAIHETARRLIPQAPRFDSLGRRALARVIRAADGTPPSSDTLQAAALAGDVATNTAYFALAVAVGSPGSAPVRGLIAGSLGGLATLELPPRLGIGPGPDELAAATRIMTVGFYAWGGLVAGLVYRRRCETSSDRTVHGSSL